MTRLQTAAGTIVILALWGCGGGAEGPAPDPTEGAHAGSVSKQAPDTVADPPAIDGGDAGSGADGSPEASQDAGMPAIEAIAVDGGIAEDSTPGDTIGDGSSPPYSATQLAQDSLTYSSWCLDEIVPGQDMPVKECPVCSDAGTFPINVGQVNVDDFAGGAKVCAQFNGTDMAAWTILTGGFMAVMDYVVVPAGLPECGPTTAPPCFSGSESPGALSAQCFVTIGCQ